MHKAVLIALGLAALLAGCSEGPAAVDHRAPPIRLQIQLQLQGEAGEIQQLRVRCPGAPGRCRQLARLRPADFRVPRGSICTSQYGGPQRAGIQGRLNRRPLHVTLRRRNGCEIALWNRLAPALGLPVL